MELYLKQKVFAFGDKYKFRDKDQNIIFYGKKPALSITKKYLMDKDNNELFMIKRKLISILPKYTIFKDGEQVMTIKKKFAFRPKFNIEDKDGVEYTIQGNLLAWDFQIYGNEKYIGSISKKIFSIGDHYVLDIADDFDPSLFCAIALIIDNCLHNENKK